jgi:hypothetical protein
MGELAQALAESEAVRRAQRGIVLAAPRQTTQCADGDELSDGERRHDSTLLACGRLGEEPTLGPGGVGIPTYPHGAVMCGRPGDTYLPPLQVTHPYLPPI